MKKEKLFRINENGYSEGKPEHSSAIHRQVAYKQIYLKNREKYPLKFSEYVVHHIDGEKLNGSVKNLYICTQKEHEWIHNEQKRILRKFQSSEEINDSLIRKRAEGTKKLKEYDYKKKKAEIEKEEKEHDEVIIEPLKEVHEGESKIYRKKYHQYNINNLRRMTVLFYRYLKKSLFLSILSIIILFVFPIAYFAFVYIAYFLLIILAYILLRIISFLFSYNWSLMEYKLETSVFSHILELFRQSAPKVWSFVYGTNTKPILVIILIVASFAVSFFLIKKSR